MTIVAAIARYLGVAGCAVVALLIYYEGIPGLRDLPFVEHIPIVRDLVVGKVDRASSAAAEKATSNLVARTELAAAQAKADELRRQLDIAHRLADAARKQAIAAQGEADSARETLEKRIEEDRNPDDSRWRQHDLDRLRQYDQRAPP